MDFIVFGLLYFVLQIELAPVVRKIVVYVGVVYFAIRLIFALVGYPVVLR